MKTEQKGVPKPGPITLRGQWSGHLLCEHGAPQVELSRKLAGYGVLRLRSSAEGWTWTVERTERWFSAPGADTGAAQTLVGAIEAGLDRAMGLLGEACSTRDPTERLRPKEPRRSPAGDPPRMDAPVPLPDAPVTPAGVQRMAEEVAREADALASVRGVSWVWQASSAVDDAVSWLRRAGLGDLGDELASYGPSPEDPPERLLERLRAELEAAEVDASARTEASAVLDRVEQAFRTAPAVLERARRLVRHAARLAETDLCRGKERKEAADAIGRAIHAYDEARAAVGQGDVSLARPKVRSMVEWAALAAAKAARSCSAGQMSLASTGSHVERALAEPAPAPPVERAPPEPAKPSRRRSRPVPAEAAAAPPTSPRRRRSATAAAEPVASEQPEVPPAASAATPTRRGRARKAVEADPVDAEKDKLLLDAFRDAVAAAMAEPEPG